MDRSPHVARHNVYHFFRHGGETPDGRIVSKHEDGYVDTGENPHSVELAERTGIELLEVDLSVSWGEQPREQTRRFSTVKAVLANRDRSRR